MLLADTEMKLQDIREFTERKKKRTYHLQEDTKALSSASEKAQGMSYKFVMSIIFK